MGILTMMMVRRRCVLLLNSSDHLVAVRGLHQRRAAAAVAADFVRGPRLRLASAAVLATTQGPFRATVAMVHLTLTTMMVKERCGLLKTSFVLSVAVARVMSHREMSVALLRPSPR